MPIWAWYQLNGKQYVPDDYLEKHKNRNLCLISFSIDSNEVLLSDSTLWQIPLNNAFLYKSKDATEYSKVEEELFGLSIEAQQKKKEDSWKMIFDITSNNKMYLRQGNSIQATLWEIKKEQIISTQKLF